ncbi:hypothetical protein N7492_008879 [Penicillium capsulatum]|uniref:F-box domain-containing protein n=1 Tax=Penicillium capsulatum TaxID=69766 RepID=A0A9W9HRH2_9EURO|nr:hypothetical protein N7492_008879 [Penicillium capsulatum]KAJ6106281.1 hypothetical protein N7512_009798 [Penicillium capsulatum]
MPTKERMHLPTEILVDIANALYMTRESTEPRMEFLRQQDMYNFCLVSRQWYRAGIACLYRQPQLFGGNRFALFAGTICPPSRKKKPTLELGSMVESLWLDKLVHHSSNSVTARLLSRTHKSLVEFVAPRVSFSSVGLLTIFKAKTNVVHRLNGLTALSKCRKLRFLNLSLVDSRSISFPSLKKAISNLSSLKGLHLPKRIPPTKTHWSDGEWPTSLTSIRIGGRLNSDVMRRFEWPFFLEELTLSQCKDLDVVLFESILAGEHLGRSLKRLVICSDNEDQVQYDATDALLSLSKLTSLEVTADILSVLTPFLDDDSKLPLRELTILRGKVDQAWELEFFEYLRDALSLCLSSLLLLKIPKSAAKALPEIMCQEVDDIIQGHLEEIPDDELDDMVLEDVGLIQYDG